MPILMLSQFYPPILGGEEQHVRRLAIELTRRGHAVEVLTIATPGTEAGAEMEDGIWVHRVSTTAQRIPWAYSDPGRPHALPLPDPETARAIGRVIESGRFDVLHAHEGCTRESSRDITALDAEGSASADRLCDKFLGDAFSVASLSEVVPGGTRAAHVVVCDRQRFVYDPGVGELGPDTDAQLGFLARS